MKRTRLAGFILFILIGSILGLIYGWVVNPTGVKSTTLASLRTDFKADYVVMVSEIYANDHDLNTSIKYLNEITPGEDVIPTVQEALLVGQQFGYSDREMRVMADLEIALTNAVKEVGQ